MGAFIASVSVASATAAVRVLLPRGEFVSKCAVSSDAPGPHSFANWPQAQTLTRAALSAAILSGGGVGGAKSPAQP